MVITKSYKFVIWGAVIYAIIVFFRFIFIEFIRIDGYTGGAVFSLIDLLLIIFTFAYIIFAFKKIRWKALLPFAIAIIIPIMVFLPIPRLNRDYFKSETVLAAYFWEDLGSTIKLKIRESNELELSIKNLFGFIRYYSGTAKIMNDTIFLKVSSKSFQDNFLNTLIFLDDSTLIPSDSLFSRIEFDVYYDNDNHNMIRFSNRYLE